MKVNKTAFSLGAASLTIAVLTFSVKLGLAVGIVLMILVRVIWRSPGSDSIIGVDHVDRPTGSTYGGGFSPGGLHGVSGLGAHFGVYGAPVADRRAPRMEYAEVRRTALSKTDREKLATAIKEAEARTGHQMLAMIGALNEDSAAKADRVAAQWPAASIVVCIDPARRRYELRWRDASFALDTEHAATFSELMRRFDLAAAVALLADVLPLQAASAELPDIIED
jgi:hypothetical protein